VCGLNSTRSNLTGMNCLYLYEVFSSRPLSLVLQDCSTCGRCRPETSRVRWAGCGVNCGHRNGQCTALSSQRFSPVDTLIPELLHLDLKLDLVSRKQSGDGLGQWSVSRLRSSDAGSSERCAHCPRSTGDKPFEINMCRRTSCLDTYSVLRISICKDGSQGLCLLYPITQVP
jgi:hypothetical protein